MTHLRHPAGGDIAPEFHHLLAEPNLVEVSLKHITHHVFLIFVKTAGDHIPIPIDDGAVYYPPAIQAALLDLRSGPVGITGKLSIIRQIFLCLSPG